MGWYVTLVMAQGMLLFWMAKNITNFSNMGPYMIVCAFDKVNFT